MRELAVCPHPQWKALIFRSEEAGESLPEPLVRELSNAGIARIDAGEISYEQFFAEKEQTADNQQITEKQENTDNQKNTENREDTKAKPESVPDGKSVLVLSARDQDLNWLKGQNIAALAYRSAAYPNEELFAAEYMTEDVRELDLEFLDRVFRRAHGIPWHILSTGRCLVDEIRQEDREDLIRLYEPPDMTRYLHGQQENLLTREGLDAYIRHAYRYYGYGMWSVRDRHTDELIGCAGIYPETWEKEQVLALGYAIRQDRWHQGYATEVCQAVLAWVEQEFGEETELFCFVDTGNSASKRLAEKLGFGPYSVSREKSRDITVYRYFHR